MSIDVMTHVWKHSRHKGSELLTLLAIADNANDQGFAHPKIATLAQKTRMTERNVQIVLKKLEQSNELALHRNAGPNGVHQYQVTLDGVKSFRGEKFSPEKISGVKSFRVKNPVKNAAPSSSPLSDSPLFISPAPEPSVKENLSVSPLVETLPHPPPVASLRKASLAKGTRRCPVDYVPAPGLRVWAQEKFPKINFDEALEAMQDWQFKDPKSDWDATLRTWIRTEAKRQTPQASARAAPLPETRLGKAGLQTELAIERFAARRRAHSHAGFGSLLPQFSEGAENDE